jgi:hypothetical protein
MKRNKLILGWIALTSLLLSGATVLAAEDGKAKAEGDALVGQPADIALSAYQYRADRKPEANSPESWLALMHHAGMPLNKPVDVNAPAIKRVLCALLWEEIRPIRRVELIWAADSKNRPPVKELAFTTLDNQGTANSWWNNLKAVQKPVAPTVSEDGRIYACDLSADTCGLVIAVSGDKAAPIKSVTVDGKEWTAFDKDKETIELKGLAGKVAVRVNY